MDQAAPRLRAYAGPPKTVYVASSSDDLKIPESRRLEPALQTAARANITWYYQPAALLAFRRVFKPRPATPAK